MAHPHYSYTPEQLLALQHSPLVKKPDDLPRIDQWIDIAAEKNERRPRTQSGVQNGKSEENEHPNKRPSLFEARQRQGQSQSGEDVFLGPKMSFASASAARQASRKALAEEKVPISTNDEPRDKYDRFGVKERPRKEGYIDREGKDKEYDGFRNKFGRQNGFQDDDEYRGKRGGDSYDRGKETREGGVSLDGLTPRRGGPMRGGKFDQPWHRDSNKQENRDERGLEDVSEVKSWRDPDRRNGRWNVRETRPEQDPQWMAEPAMPDFGDPTQEDFQKWKDKMKAGSDQKAQAVEEPSERIEAPSAPAPSAENKQTSAKAREPFLGIWGEQKGDAPKAEVLPPTPKATAKPKASRFATMFKDNQEVATPAQPEPAPPSDWTFPGRAPPKNTAEDQEGFERMMQMLRMGQGVNQNPQPQLFGRPTSAQFGDDPVRGPDMPQMQERNNFNTDPASRGAPNPPPNYQQGPRNDQGPPGPQRSMPSNQDSSFLLRLMQQQPSQPQPTFASGQIYGQGYDQREPDDRNSYSGAFPPNHHQEPRSREHPPGLFANEGAYTNNQVMDNPQFRPDVQMRHPPPMQMNERFGGPLQRPIAPEDANMHQGPPMFDQFAPSNNSRPNLPPPGHDGIPPPPGFSASRGQAPPGFYPYGGNQPSQQQQQQQQQQQPLPPPPPPPPQQQQQQFGNGPPPNARGPMQQPHLQQPPGFYGNTAPSGLNQVMPPGFRPPMNNPQQHRGQPLRQQVPLQGPEGYNDGSRRGPPPPPMQPQQWPPQFVKQMGGGYQM